MALFSVGKGGLTVVLSLQRRLIMPKLGDGYGTPRTAGSLVVIGCDRRSECAEHGKDLIPVDGCGEAAPKQSTSAPCTPWPERLCNY
jgi:hypothetical protein